MLLAGGALRTNSGTDIGRASMPYVQGERSYGRADPGEIQRWLSAGSQ